VKAADEGHAVHAVLRVFKLASLYADDALLHQTVNTTKDAELFQNNINAVYEWSIKWKMLFNEKKCQTINFGKVTPIPHYKLGTTCLA